MREVTVRQYCINPGIVEDTYLANEINSILKEGWILKHTHTVTNSFDRDTSNDYMRIMDANISSLKKDTTHYLVCIFERTSVGQVLYGDK